MILKFQVIIMSTPCLLIIDMQNDFICDDAPLPIPGAQNIIPTVKSVLDIFRAHSLPIFHIQRIHRRDGSDVEISRRELFATTPFAVEGTHGACVIDDLCPLPDEYIIRKTRMSAFIHTELDLLLRSLAIDTIYITGIQTPNCIRATAFDAFAYNYHTILIEDAITAKNEDIHHANIIDMTAIGIRVLQYADIMNELKN